MSTLYIRTPLDLPHEENPHRPGWSRCGLDLTGAKRTDDKAADVFLDHRRCPSCFPGWSSHESAAYRRAA